MPELQCAVCNKLFHGAANNRRYCSVRCRNSNFRKRERALKSIDKAETQLVYHHATELILQTWSQLAAAGQLPQPMLFVDNLASQSFVPPDGVMWSRGASEPSHWVMWG